MEDTHTHPGGAQSLETEYKVTATFTATSFHPVIALTGNTASLLRSLDSQLKKERPASHPPQTLK